MRANEMTMTEFLEWNGKGGAEGLEQYKKLLTRKHWLTGRFRGQSEVMLEAYDSMSVFDETEHDDPQFIKYLNKYQEAFKKVREYKTQLEEVSEQLNKHIK